MKIATITDGTSNTAFASELITPAGNDSRGAMYYPEGPVYQHTDTPNSGVDQCRSGQYVNNDPMAPAITTFNSWNDVNERFAARSRHTGGVNLLLGDGSVRFVRNEVDILAWFQMNSRNDGVPFNVTKYTD